MKATFTFIIFVFIQLSSIAQRTKYYTPAIRYSQWSVKFSPICFLEPDQSMALSVEYRPAANVGLQLGVSYIFNTEFLAFDRFAENTTGYKILPELRMYNTTRTAHQLHKYIGIQLGYKHVSKDVSSWERKNNYQVQETVSLKKYTGTTAIILGMQRHPKRIGFDFNIAFGVKYKYLTSTPELAKTKSNLFPSYYGEAWTGYYPHFNATFNVCYSLKKINTPMREVDY